MTGDAALALLALEDGSVYPGRAVGAPGVVLGEMVFNTALTGYQEVLTDPSYRQQLVVFTQPHIGNVGVNPEDEESDRIQVAGMVARAVCAEPSNWRSRESLPAYLGRHQVPGIAGLDTRVLTAKLRVQGALKGCLVSMGAKGYERIADAAKAHARAGPAAGADMQAPMAALAAGDHQRAAQQAVAIAQNWEGLEGRDLASTSGTRDSYEWLNGTAGPGAPVTPVTAPAGGRYRVCVYDFGVKRSILRVLTDFGCRLTVVPGDTPAERVLAEPGIDGVFLSNGPGDPAACADIIAEAQQLATSGLPVLGICLGHQLLALALGARTVKMKFGHHGANHPVQALDTGRVFITSQNHGFAVDETSLPAELRATHRSLFDGTLQGLRHVAQPVFGFQGHPEASPGPHDVRASFTEYFIRSMEQRRVAG